MQIYFKKLKGKTNSNPYGFSVSVENVKKDDKGIVVTSNSLYIHRSLVKSLKQYVFFGLESSEKTRKIYIPKDYIYEIK